MIEKKRNLPILQNVPTPPLVIKSHVTANMYNQTCIKRSHLG